MTKKRGGRIRDARPDPFVKGLAASCILHMLLLFALIFSFFPPAQTIPPPNSGFPVELVELGPGSAVLNPAVPTPNRQPESRISPSLPLTSRPLLKLPAAGANSGLEMSDSLQKAAKASAAGAPGTHKPSRGAAESNAPPAAPDLQSQLQALALQQQNQARTSQKNSIQVAEGGQPFYSATIYRAKDFVRAQIERHWYLDRQAAGAADFNISLHLELQSDGSVLSAEIIRDSNLAGSAAYRSAASSLRGAALLSSPLVIPEGQYEAVKDIELTFRPKDALQ